MSTSTSDEETAPDIKGHTSESRLTTVFVVCLFFLLTCCWKGCCFAVSLQSYQWKSVGSALFVDNVIRLVKHFRGGRGDLL